MNKLLVVSLLALSFATGFTCSKNAPTEAAAPAQTEMAAPVSADESAAPAPTEAAPAAPTENK